jgi:Caspase domain
MFRFLISLIGIALVLTSTALAQNRGLFMLTPTDTKQPVTLYQKSYALVIGIDRYTGGWPRLSNAVADAKAVTAELAERNFNVTTVLNPGSAELRRRLEDFIFEKGRDKSARLFIWYSGHGHTVDGEGYLAPADAPITPAWKFRRNAFSLRSFGRLMREAKSKHVLAVFDSCFAGTVFNTVRSLPSKAITRATTLPVRQFVSSGEAKQEVSDDGSFRKLFIDALRGDEIKADANGDGFITGTEVGLFLSDKVTNLTEGKQTPRYGKLRSLGLDRGEFVFRSRASARMAAKPRLSPRMSASEAFKIAQSIGSCSAYDFFLNDFPKGFFANMAKAWKGKNCVPEPDNSATSLPDDGAQLAMRVQTELQRVGCLIGSVDGKWGRQSQRSLARFYKATSMNIERSRQPSLAALRVLESKLEKVCFALSAPTVAKTPTKRRTKRKSATNKRAQRKASRVSACTKWRRCMSGMAGTKWGGRLAACGTSPTGC